MGPGGRLRAGLRFSGSLIDVLERLGVAWYVGGSIASTVHGRFRATNDVDVIAELRYEFSTAWGLVSVRHARDTSMPQS